MGIRLLADELKQYIWALNEGKATIKGTQYVDKDWLSKALRSKNFEGPNGNLVVGYEWKWKWGFKFKKGKGDIEARISDWDEAETCSACNRKLVHIFYVLDKGNNEVRPYGFDDTHKALGIAKELSQSMITKIKNAVSVPKGQKALSKSDAKNVKAVIKIYGATAHEEPIRAFNRYNNAYGTSFDMADKLFYHVDDEKYVFIDELTDAALKKVDRLVPELVKVTPESKYGRKMKSDLISFYTSKYAQDSPEEAGKYILKMGRSPGKYYAANFDLMMVMYVPKGTIGETDILPAFVPGWEVGDRRILDRFRKKMDEPSDDAGFFFKKGK